MNLNIWGDFQICISVPLNNKYLCAKKPHKMNLRFSKYAGVMAKFSVIREVAADIYKETGSYQLLKWI